MEQETDERIQLMDWKVIVADTRTLIVEMEKGHQAWNREVE